MINKGVLGRQRGLRERKEDNCRGWRWLAAKQMSQCPRPQADALFPKLDLQTNASNTQNGLKTLYLAVLRHRRVLDELDHFVLENDLARRRRNIFAEPERIHIRHSNAEAA